MTTGEIAVLVLGTMIILSASALVYVIVKLKQMQNRDLDL